MKIKKKIFIQATAMIMALSLPLTTVAQAEDKQTRATTTPVVIDSTNFPNANFQNYVSTNFDKDANGSLSETEISLVTEIHLYNKSISSLEGVQYFTALTYLDCSYNSLTELDVSNNIKLENLYCKKNQLTELDVSKNTALVKLSATENQLTSIDVSNNTKLDTLFCDGNQLTSIDISKNTALTYLYFSYNQLTELDVSNNTKLDTLFCDGNQLTSIDVSKNTALGGLSAPMNQLTSIDVSNNTELGYLNCEANQLTTLDLSKNTKLQNLYCDNNQLTTLDLSSHMALERLWCTNNKLVSLRIPAVSSFKDLVVRDQQTVGIYIDSEGKFDLATLDSEIDSSKISNLTSGTLDGTVLSGLQKGDQVQYTYDFGAPDNTTLTSNLEVIDQAYEVVVNGGTGSKVYPDGETVTIKADVPEKGKQFKEWQVISGSVTLDNAKSATATFTMPAENVEITATYEDVTITSSSSDSTYQIGSGKNLTYRCSSLLENFVGIYMDDELIDASHYTLKSGSTIVTINGSYLDTLTVGKHTIRFEYKDGVIAETELTIKAKEAEIKPEDKPNTPTKPEIKPEDKPNDSTKPEIKPEDKPNNPITPDDKVNTPSDEVKTGDETNIAILTTLFVMTGLIAFVVKRKHNKN